MKWIISSHPHAARVSPYNVSSYIYINIPYYPHIYILYYILSYYIILYYPIYPYFGIHMSQRAFSCDCLLTCSPLGFPNDSPRLWRFFAATSLDNSSNNLKQLKVDICSLITYNHVHASSFLGNDQQILLFRWLNHVIIMWQSPFSCRFSLEKVILFAFSVSLISWWPKMFQDVGFLKKIEM